MCLAIIVVHQVLLEHYCCNYFSLRNIQEPLNLALMLVLVIFFAQSVARMEIPMEVLSIALYKGLI